MTSYADFDDRDFLDNPIETEEQFFAVLSTLGGDPYLKAMGHDFDSVSYWNASVEGSLEGGGVCQILFYANDYLIALSEMRGWQYRTEALIIYVEDNWNGGETDVEGFYSYQKPMEKEMNK